MKRLKGFNSIIRYYQFIQMIKERNDFFLHRSTSFHLRSINIKRFYFVRTTDV